MDLSILHYEDAQVRWSGAGLLRDRAIARHITVSSTQFFTTEGLLRVTSIHEMQIDALSAGFFSKSIWHLWPNVVATSVVTIVVLDTFPVQRKEPVTCQQSSHSATFKSIKPARRKTGKVKQRQRWPVKQVKLAAFSTSPSVARKNRTKYVFVALQLVCNVCRWLAELSCEQIVVKGDEYVNAVCMQH